MANIQRTQKTLNEYFQEERYQNAKNNWTNFANKNLKILYKDKYNVIWEVVG